MIVENRISSVQKIYIREIILSVLDNVNQLGYEFSKRKYIRDKNLNTLLGQAISISY